MKELELAYTGTKRNLFCIEKEFVMTEKPNIEVNPEDYNYDQRGQVMSYYIDTMGDNSVHLEERQEEEKLIEMSAHDEDLRLPPPSLTATNPEQLEDASMDITSSSQLPFTSIYQSDNVNNNFTLNASTDSTSHSQIDSNEYLQDNQTITSAAVPVVPETLPKAARHLLHRITSNQKEGTNLSENAEVEESSDTNVNNINGTDLNQEEKRALSDSDDDTEDAPLKAALKNLQSNQTQPSNLDHQKSSHKSKPKIDITKMLNVIRQTSNQLSNSASSNSNSSNKHAAFWQNILSGTSLASTSSLSSASECRDPRMKIDSTARDSRDPRLKRSKDGKSLSNQVDSSLNVESNQSKSANDLMKENEVEYKLYRIDVPDLDYSCYDYIFRTDVKMKNDPRLQNYFNKCSSSISSSSITSTLPSSCSSSTPSNNSSVIDDLYKILPTTQSASLKSSAPLVSSLTSLPSLSLSKKDDDNNNLSSSSTNLPPLPPLTLTQPKSSSLSSMVPLPPPLMSAYELTSSKPSFTSSSLSSYVGGSTFYGDNGEDKIQMKEEKEAD